MTANGLTAVCAQSNTILDSLKLELTKSSNLLDSAKILCRLTWKASETDAELTFKYGMKALNLVPRIRDNEILAETYDAAALGYWLKSDLPKARDYYKKSLVIGEKYKFTTRIAWENYNLAQLTKDNFREMKEYATAGRKAFKKLNNAEMVINCNWLLVSSTKQSNNIYVDTLIYEIETFIKQTSVPSKLLQNYQYLIILYGWKENKTKSMMYALQALDIAERINNEKGIVKAYYQIGSYLRDSQHNYDVALLYFNKDLDIYKKNKIESGIADVFNEIGTVYKLMGKDSLALNSFNESLAIGKKINKRHLIANAYKSIGEISYLKKNYNDALIYYLKCYTTGCDVCPLIAFHQVLVDIGQVYLIRHDFQNALKFFNQSLLLADTAKADYERAVSLSALGDYNMQIRNLSSAIKYYQEAFAAINLLSLHKEIASKLSKVYKEQNNFARALEYLNLSNILSDSLNKLNEAENLSRLETKFEFQNFKMQKEHELKANQIQANAEIEKQSQIKYFFVAGFVLVSISGFFLYRGFQRKKRDNLVLENQKKKLEEMSVKIHNADQKKLSFFTNISHELRTPLTLILGPAEKLIKENSGNGDASPMLNIIHRNTLQLYNLINQLLDIRKLDTGNVKLKVSKGDIVKYCKGIFSTFAHLGSEKNISFNFKSGCESFNTWFDPDIIGKTLNNLFSNAFKYTPAGGEIILTISGYPEKGNDYSNVFISVEDNGKGIPDDQLKYVFDRYYQVENTNTGFNTGTGIGLAYTKELIELHHGKISVESKNNIGTKFTIELPVHESEYCETEKSNILIDLNETSVDEVRNKFLKEMISNEHVSITEQQIESSVDEREVMLIVEDNPDLRIFIKSIFEKDYVILEAEDGTTGYTKAAEIIPDVIISDIMMPGMNGLELCARLKNNIHTNHIPVLILTAKVGEENEIEGLKTGADDYLTKPFNSQILEMRINRLITSRERLREFFTKEFLLNPKEVNLPSREDEFIKNAVKVVEDNIANPDLNVEMLMNELGVSRTQLFRKLKAITNYSANQFIRNIKLKRAAQLLRHNSYNITEVLYLSGFNSHSYFTSCFKEVYGCLPKEYTSRESEKSYLVN
jgi:signal transduction histidine kinase/DNA-binding response OmpR family regulator